LAQHIQYWKQSVLGCLFVKAAAVVVSGLPIEYRHQLPAQAFLSL
jgi:hypothetical protein